MTPYENVWLESLHHLVIFIDMIRSFTYIVALLILSTLLVVSLGIGVINIRQKVVNPETFACGVVDEYDAYLSANDLTVNHPGRTIFENNCTVCHAVNQAVVGPALGGVSERRDSLWIVQMIRNSEKLIASGDATAINLYRAYNQTRMPSYQSLPDSSIQLMIEYIDLATEQIRALPVPAEVLPAAL